MVKNHICNVKVDLTLNMLTIQPIKRWWGTPVDIDVDYMFKILSLFYNFKILQYFDQKICLKHF